MKRLRMKKNDNRATIYFYDPGEKPMSFGNCPDVETLLDILDEIEIEMSENGEYLPEIKKAVVNGKTYTDEQLDDIALDKSILAGELDHGGMISTDAIRRIKEFKKAGKLKGMYKKYDESTKRFGKKFNENIHRPDVEDLDVPVTEQEKLLCKYIPDEVEEFCRKNGLEVTCGANWHNPGEEQHIEIYVGIPEGDDQTDPKYDNIEENLEMLVNGIGDAENEGEKWGDASFQWISDEEIFGELWPLEGESDINQEGELAEESAGVEVPDDAVKVVADRAIELLESLGKSKNVIMYLIDPERTAVGGENTSALRNMVENRLWDWIEGDMPRNGNADYTLTELYEMIKSGEL